MVYLLNEDHPASLDWVVTEAARADGRNSGLPTLTTPRLVLRPLSRADAPRVKEMAGAREVADTTLNMPHPCARMVYIGFK